MNRDEWLRLHGRYEKRAFRIIRNGFRSIVADVPFKNINKANYAAVIDAAIDEERVFKVLYKVHLEIGLLHGKRIIQDVQREYKNLPLFNQTFQDILTKWIVLKAGSKFRLIRGALAEFLIELIADLFDQGYSVHDIITIMTKQVRERGFYRWQMARIARTESTAAANFGAIQSGRTLGIRMQKLWISVQDNRTRIEPYNHLFMDGVTVPDGEMFNVNGDFLEFPGDPQGKAGNVINCRCAVSMIPYRDNNGRLIL